MTEPRKELERIMSKHVAEMKERSKRPSWGTSPINPRQREFIYARLVISAHTELTATCLWEEHHLGDFWSGACGASWIFTNGGPTDNQMTYCPQCGRRVVLPESQENDD